jgi:hypothetical protein
MQRPGYLRRFSGMQSRGNFGKPPPLPPPPMPKPPGPPPGPMPGPMPPFPPYGYGYGYPYGGGYPLTPIEIVPEFVSRRRPDPTAELEKELAAMKLALLKAELEKEQAKNKGLTSAIAAWWKNR